MYWSFRACAQGFWKHQRSTSRRKYWKQGTLSMRQVTPGATLCTLMGLRQITGVDTRWHYWTGQLQKEYRRLRQSTRQNWMISLRPLRTSCELIRGVLSFFQTAKVPFKLHVTFSVHPVAAQIHLWLNMLRAWQKTVKFCWVPSLVDVPGNERADMAARAMVSSERYVPQCSILCRDLYPHIRSVLLRRWQKSWSSSGLDKHRLIKDSVYPYCSGTVHRKKLYKSQR